MCHITCSKIVMVISVAWQECTYFVCAGEAVVSLLGWSTNVYVRIQTNINQPP